MVERSSALEKVKKLDAERAKIIEDAKQEAMATAQTAIEELNALGFTFKLVEVSQERKGRGRGTSSLPPKYVNPKNPSQTWSGKGRGTPKWMQELLDMGHRKEEFLNPDRA